MENTLNIESLLTSAEFTAQVNKIANDFGVGYHDTMKEDVRQACSIAAYEALQKYVPEKVGNNFWGYAYPRMHEYAKREVYNQRHIIHIPLNRVIDNDRYERVAYTYEGLTFEDDHDKFGTIDDDTALGMDIQSALEILEPQSRYILEVVSELKKSESDKSSISALSKELGISSKAVQMKLNEAKQQVAMFLNR